MVLFSTAVRLWLQKGSKHRIDSGKTTLLAWQGHKITKEVIYYCYSLKRGYNHLSNYLSSLGLLTFSQIACHLYWPLYKIDRYLHYFCAHYGETWCGLKIKHVCLYNGRHWKHWWQRFSFSPLLFHFFLHIFLKKMYVVIMLTM